MTAQAVYLNKWKNQEDLKDAFWPAWGESYSNELEGLNILLASYGTPWYLGYAFVLFEKDGKLFEVNGAHCSCRGLENQWEPEETSKEELYFRLENGNLGKGEYDENPFADELRSLLNSL